MRKKFCRFVLPALAMFSLFGMGAGVGVNQVQEVGLGVDNKADVKRAYSNSKNLVLPTSTDDFCDYKPRCNYVGYGYTVSGGIASASNGVLTFNSEMTTCFNSLNSRIANNPAVGYVCFRFLTNVFATQGSTGTAYPGSDSFDDSFKVTDNYYSFITEVENVNTLEKLKSYVQGKATGLGNECNGVFGLSFATVNHENTLVDGKIQNVYYYVPNVPTIADVLSNVTAVDLFGKDVAVNCSDSEKAHYTGKIGVSDVKVSATDSYGQTATATIRINVIDHNKPVVSLKNGITLSFVANRDTLKASDVPNFFDITDDGTAFGGSIGTPTYTFDGNALSDIAFSSSDVKTHQIGVSVSDSSGNTYSGSFAMAVVDGTAPVISRVDGGAMSNVVKIGLSKTFVLTKADYLALFKASDDVDGDVTSRLSVDGDFLPNKVGNCSIKLKVSDNAGNTGTATTSVEIIADIPPVFILSDTLVLTDTATVLSLNQLSAVVTNGICSGQEVVGGGVTDTGGYLDSPTVANDYTISYSVTVKNSVSGRNVKSLATQTTQVDGSYVLRVKAADDSKEEESKTHWYDGIVSFFRKLGNWFRGVFTKFKFDCFITDDEWSTRFSA